MAEEKTTAEVMLMLTTAYPDREVPPDTLRLYHTMLKDIPTDILEAAVLKHISESKWFPKVAELREGALQIARRAMGRENPEEAWEKVQSVIRKGAKARLFYEGPPRFANTLIERTIQTIGWQEIMLTDKPGVTRKHFIDVYASFQRRAEEEEQTHPAVAGVIENLTQQMLMDGRRPALDAPRTRSTPDLTPETQATSQIKARPEGADYIASLTWTTPAEVTRSETKRSEVPPKPRDWMQGMTPEQRQQMDAAAAKVAQYQEDKQAGRLVQTDPDQ